MREAYHAFRADLNRVQSSRNLAAFSLMAKK
jgi:hypothetical protein